MAGQFAPWQAAAAEIEAAVVDQARPLLRPPEIVVGTWRRRAERRPT